MVRMSSDDLARAPRLRYPINEVAHLLGISSANVRRKIASGEIAHVRDGGRVLIPAAEVQRITASDVA